MNKNIKEVFNQKAKSIAVLILTIGLIVHPLWIFFDYILAPNYWKQFAVLRIIETISWAVLIYLMKKNIVSWKTTFAIVAISLNAIIAYMINVVPEGSISSYFAGFTTVISVMAFFIYFSWLEYLIIFVVALLSVLGFHFLFPNHSVQTIFGNGGMTYLSMGIFGTFLCKLKQQSIINEITANLKVQEAYEELSHINEELKIVNEQLNDQKQKLVKQNEDILSSIKYAYYLQSAILNDESLLQKYFPDKYFFLYMPRDIVSGDFLWTAENDEYIFVALADSTGHGVPGAMVSIFCNNALNDAFQSLKEPTPAKILTKTREIIKKQFLAKGREIKDGMDIAMVAIKKDRTKMIFAAANNSICIYTTDKEIVKVRGNKMPVGLYFLEEDFSDKELSLENIETIYLYSDGYADQFGGPQDKKLMFGRFKKLLKDFAELPLKEQKQELKNFIELWKTGTEQTDDISILAIKPKN